MEIMGVLFTFLMGTLLHFVYTWSNGAVWSILFGAINESVWEHVKIFAMPYLLWGVFELACARPYFKMFVISKVVGLYFLAAAIILFITSIQAYLAATSLQSTLSAFLFGYRLRMPFPTGLHCLSGTSAHGSYPRCSPCCCLGRCILAFQPRRRVLSCSGTRSQIHTGFTRQGFQHISNAIRTEKKCPFFVYRFLFRRFVI